MRKRFTMIRSALACAIFTFMAAAYSAEAAVQVAPAHAILSDGSLWSWGYTNTAAESTAFQIGTAQNWAKLSASYMARWLAIKDDGTLWSLGSDSYQVRIGTDTDWVDAVGGGEHYVALKADGTLWTWGTNWAGALGDGTNVTRSTPASVGGADWAAIGAGYSHTLAIKKDGTLWSWGNNWKGQLGHGFNAPDAWTPTQVGTDTHWAKVVGYGHSTMALKDDGTLWAWGSNYSGNLCNGSTSSWGVHLPTKIGTDTDWTDITGGLAHSLVLKANGSLWMCGTFNYDLNGDGAAESSAAPVRLGTDSDWIDMAAGASHSIAAKADGTIWAWGDGTNGELGDGRVLVSPEPVQVGADCDWSTITLGDDHSMSVKLNGGLWGWGQNSAGILGNGTTMNQAAPVQTGADLVWKKVSAGKWHTAGVRLDGTLWAWGQSLYDRNGDGTADLSSTPVQIGTDADWDTVAAGASSTYAIKTDGTLWAWGSTYYDRDGNGTPEYTTVPMQVGTDGNWAAVDVYYHVLAIKTDGTLWSWGSNNWGGSLGDGTGTDRYTPLQVGLDSDWAMVAAGHSHSLAVKTGGTLWSWGSNQSSQLGRAAGSSNSPTPGRIGTETDWSFVAAGERHSLALKTDGSLWSWGYCGFGACGNHVNNFWRNSFLTPARVGTADDWVSVDGGSRHSGGVREDGSAWSWGYTYSGQLGTGVFGYSYSLVPVLFSGGASPRSWADHGTGLYPHSVTVTLTAIDNLIATVEGWDPNPTIYYTTNGSEPTTNSNIYYGPLTFTSTRTLRFFAVDRRRTAEPVKHTETYTIHYPPANQPPAPTAAPIVATEGTAGSCQVSPNDPDGGDSHTFAVTDGPSHGTAAVSGSGLVTYSAGAGYVGGDSLTITVRDQAGAAGSVVIPIQVGPETAPPACAADPAGGLFQEQVTVTLTATDNLDPNPTIYYTTDGSEPSTGSAVYSSALTVTHTTTLRFFAVDRRLNAEAVTHAETYVVNHRPAPAAAPIVVVEGTAGSSQVSPNDPDDGDSHTFALLSGPSHGTAAVSGTGLVTFSAGVGYAGDDSLIVTVIDQTGAGGSVTVPIRIDPDTTAPAISGYRAPEANTEGWNNTDVTVYFTASDADSGVASVTGTTVVSTEGSGQQVIGTAVDRAGNSSTFVVGEINIDKTAPTVDAGPDVNVIEMTPVALPTPLVEDNLDPAPLVTSNAPASYPLGATTVTVTATDKAGNAASDSLVVQVWTMQDYLLFLKAAINALPPAAFKNNAEQRKNAFGNKIDAVISMVAAAQSAADPAVRDALLAEAIGKMENDIQAKMDGCRSAGAPDANDWIVDCAAQADLNRLIDLVLAALNHLRNA